MNGEFLVFLALALIAIMGGVLMLNVEKVMHMVLSLVLTFLSIAGLYMMLWAEFVGVVQILIYSGAVTIIMIFGIMLTKHNDEQVKRSSLRSILVFLAVLVFGGILYFAVNNVDFTQQGKAVELYSENTKQIGKLLYTEYIIPFEITSILLLVALIGAIILAKNDNEEEGDARE